ncbi:MAG: VCBS repeat-containing protein, partial [Lentisphaerota bacterium]
MIPASAHDAPDITGLQVAHGQIELATTSTNAFMVERKTMSSEWETLGVFTPSAADNAEWYRVMIPESFDPTRDADKFVFQPGSSARDTSDGSGYDSDYRAVIARISSEDGSLVYGPLQTPVSPADSPTAAGNNHATATPDPGTRKLFWHNQTVGSTYMWILSDGGAMKSLGPMYNGNISSAWLLAGVGDINRDGVDDIIWHNQTSGSVHYWLLAPDGVVVSNGPVYSGTISTAWKLGGVGDINRDGTVDIIWHNQTSGAVHYWFLNPNGTLLANGPVYSSTILPSWRLAAAGDINRDGTMDLVWHNQTSGRVSYWMLKADGTLLTNGYVYGGSILTSWRLGGAGDINRDGTLDVIWHNQSTGAVHYWLLNADGTLGSNGPVYSSPIATTWRLAGAGDINMDGTVDIVWHNQTTGYVYYWLLNPDGTYLSSGPAYSGAISTAWR